MPHPIPQLTIPTLEQDFKVFQSNKDHSFRIKKGADNKTNQLSPAIGPVEDQGSPRIPSTGVLCTLLPTSTQESTWWDVLSRPRPETKFIPNSYLLRFGKYTCCTTPCTGHWKSRATAPSPTCHKSECKWDAAKIVSG